MVPQLASIGTVDSLQPKANCAPDSIGPHVFHMRALATHDTLVPPGHLVAGERTEESKDVPTPGVHSQLRHVFTFLKKLYCSTEG